MTLLSAAAAALLLATATSGQRVPKPPRPEAIDIIELPLPPVISSEEVGACTQSANPHRTGCIGQDFVDFQSGDFTPDGNHVVVNLLFVGAPAAPDPASIYTGEQLILVKTNGKTFANGDPWRCITCGVPVENAQSIDPQRDYPHVARSGKKALWGHNIIDAGDTLLTSDAWTPNNTFIYPIFWPVSADGETAGVPREMRLHPDDVHMGWSSFTDGGQNAFFGRLQFNANPSTGPIRAPRYDLVDIDLLQDTVGPKSLVVNDKGELEHHPEAAGVGELRGFSGSGDEILYVGPTVESCNHDIYAIHLVTGKVRRLTSHPEYADPVAFSPDNKWFCTMDTRGSNRQMFLSGMRGIPPLTDGLTVMAAASTRNNYHRRFFQPIVIDRHGDRGSYYGQQVNAGGDENWNGRADPAFSHDSTKLVYWQALVTSPACGGVNPLACPVSDADGGRVYRVMLAKFKNRKPTKPAPVFKVPKSIPWAIPHPPGSEFPTPLYIEPGNYILRGKLSGTANASFIADPATGRTNTISVEYDNYSDYPEYVINGVESVTSTPDPSGNVWMSHLDWTSDLVGTGIEKATKKTGPGGFQLAIDAMYNVFDSNGTLTTTIDGVSYYQPANGT
ncbi:hypothetical protein BJY04DRAFT_208664 [Aspergillus karnatakaensis]|uniref:uncharacterized protein n=1 Tax=Aspergillus karnatakaensis TaxID=1810916 RepID=UPI003CCD4F0B